MGCLCSKDAGSTEVREPLIWGLDSCRRNGCARGGYCFEHAARAPIALYLVYKDLAATRVTWLCCSSGGREEGGQPWQVVLVLAVVLVLVLVLVLVDAESPRRRPRPCPCTGPSFRRLCSSNRRSRRSPWCTPLCACAGGAAPLCACVGGGAPP